MAGGEGRDARRDGGARAGGGGARTGGAAPCRLPHRLRAGARPALALFATLLLAAAAVARGAAEPPEAAVVADLPFLERGLPGSVHVDLAREDAARRLPLQVDTGASTSLMEPGLARRLGVRPRGAKTTPYRRATRLGRPLSFWVQRRGGGWEGDLGLLGGSFLSHYVLEIDWGARRVRFLDPERYAVPESAPAPGETVLPMELAGSRPFVTIEVAGEPLPVLLDTGASFGVVLGPAAARARGIEARPAPGLVAEGVDGPLEVEFAVLPRVAVGELVFERVPAVVAPHGIRQQGGPTDSLLGHDLLAACVLRIDYPRRRVWLRRRPDAPLRLSGADWRAVRTSGALLYARGGAVLVGAVLPGGAAARRGLRPGDVLMDADAKAEGFDARAVHAELAGEAPLRVERADEVGRTRAVTLPPASLPAPERAPGAEAEADAEPDRATPPAGERADEDAKGGAPEAETP